MTLMPKWKGKGWIEDIVGNYALGYRNDIGHTLVDYCQEENLAIANTWFQLQPRRLYTWKELGNHDDNLIRNQVDYILIEKRYRWSTRYNILPQG